MQCAVQNVREMMFEGCSFGFWLVGRMFEVFYYFYVFFAARFSLEGCLLCFLALVRFVFSGGTKIRFSYRKKHSGLNITNSLQKSANFVLLFLFSLNALFVRSFPYTESLV